jgi:hypothetical protein
MFTQILCFFAVFIQILANQDEGVIDLMQFGAKLFGNPVKNDGSLVNNPNINPEEIGPYVEGDLLVPIQSKNGMTKESLRWKNGEVPYVIKGRFSELMKNARKNFKFKFSGSSEMNVIQNGFNQFHKNTCIKFIPRRATHKDYISIENAQTGCWSSVGRIGGEQKVNLQSPGCVTKHGTVIHEMLHALGFLHEQNREERDSFVTILEKNIRPGYEANFKKASAGETTGFGVGYDYGRWVIQRFEEF